MIKSYCKIALRQIARDKTHSFINIAGLSVGMAVTLLIGLWMRDELSYDHFAPDHARIGQVMQSRTINGNIKTNGTVPVPLADELAKSYGSDFRYIVLASWNWNHILSAGEKNLSQKGRFMGPDAPNLFALNMLSGSRNGLQAPSYILLSQTLARSLFGNADPMGRTITMDNRNSLRVSGIYQDFPSNASFHDVSFIAPWDVFAQNELRPETKTDWNDDSYQLYVQIADRADMQALSARIKDAKLKKTDPANARYKPSLFIQSMDRWHLYSEFTNGVNTGGRIRYVWLFGIIGAFVLLLACINFMNLSTARSEKRAKEVGIRKTIGSARGQLILQFFSESFLMALLAFAVALLLTAGMLPFFNGIAGKNMSIAWGSPWFWLSGLAFSLITGLLAGSYPALYLSSFRPVKVLKGVFTAGRNAAIPRRVLVVLQFTVSVILIIGTGIVFQQIRYAMDRPAGYDRGA